MPHTQIPIEIHTTKTTDKWMLQIIHYPPRGNNIAPHPVILCHGLAANKNSCDFGEPGTPEWERNSLAAYLSQPHTSGPVFDVWVPELRGNRHPPQESQLEPKHYHWCVDDYIDKDVPAIIKYIHHWYQEKKHYTPPVFWVGKSMGGMIAYAYGQTPEGKKNLKGVVTIGSPVLFSTSNLFLEFITRITPRNISLPIRITELIEKSGEIAHQFKGMGVNVENMNPQVLQTYMRIGLTGVLSSKVLSQFSLFFKHMTFCRYPRYPWLYDIFGRVPRIKKVITPYSYTENLHRFITPLLILSGAHDQLAPKQDMLYVKDHVGSKDVAFLEFSKDAGYQADYGHLDLTLGVHAHDEVYPAIYDWLWKRSEGSKPMYLP